jgi:hypothetical protein
VTTQSCLLDRPTLDDFSPSIRSVIIGSSNDQADFSLDTVECAELHQVFYSTRVKCAELHHGFFAGARLCKSTLLNFTRPNKSMNLLYLEFANAHMLWATVR